MKRRKDTTRVVREYRCAIDTCDAHVRIATVWFPPGEYHVMPPEWTPHPEYEAKNPTHAALWERGIGYETPPPQHSGWRATFSGTFCPEHAEAARAYEAANSRWWMKLRDEKKTWWETLGQFLPKPLRDRFTPETPEEPKPVPPWEMP
jgi:hypothetical protein